MKTCKVSDLFDIQYDNQSLEEQQEGQNSLHYLVSGKEMELLDRNTSVHFGVPELVLMEQAAMTFVWKFFELQRTYKKACNRILIVCGSGNNGADGLAVTL